MGVENVVCPNCGKEALATVPKEKRLHSVDTTKRRTKGSVTRSKSKCEKCNGSFYVYTQKK